MIGIEWIDGPARGNTWSDDDTEALKRLEGRLEPAELADIFGRSTEAVRLKAGRLARSRRAAMRSVAV
jgi:hypothetical protein